MKYYITKVRSISSGGRVRKKWTRSNTGTDMESIGDFGDAERVTLYKHTLTKLIFSVVNL